MGQTCSKAYDFDDDNDNDDENYYYYNDNNNNNNNPCCVLTESNPRRKGFRGLIRHKKLSFHESHSHHHHHRHYYSNSIARLDPALFALQERSLGLYDQYYHYCQQQQPTATANAATSSGEGASNNNSSSNNINSGQEVVTTATFTSANAAAFNVGQYHLLFKKQQQQQQKTKSVATTGTGTAAPVGPLRRGRPRKQKQKQQQQQKQHKQQKLSSSPPPSSPLQVRKSMPSPSQQQQDATTSIQPQLAEHKHKHEYDTTNIITTLDEIRSEPFVVPGDDYSTRLVVRRHPVKQLEEGLSGTHIYAVRWPRHEPLSINRNDNSSDDDLYAAKTVPQQEQSPLNKRRTTTTSRRSSQSSRSNGGNGSPSSAPTTKTTVATTTTTTTTTTTAVEPTLPKSAATASATTTTTTTTTGSSSSSTKQAALSSASVSTPTNVDLLFHPGTLSAAPKRKVHDWVTVSEENNIYLADTGLTSAECDHLVQVTEQVCRGQYAAYTYAKQTLGCREFPALAQAVHETVHTIVNGILTTLGEPKNNSSSTSSNGNSGNSGNTAKKPKKLALDDREPHMVKYDVSKKERQKLDMHTDKSEWTFLISLSNGCGYDYEGGGTYFECLDATIHIQRGHALIFPGKLRHCGQRISHGLRFLLVGFLVDKSPLSSVAKLTKKDDNEDDDGDDDDGRKGRNDSNDGGNKNKDSGSFPNVIHSANVP